MCGQARGGGSNNSKDGSKYSVTTYLMMFPLGVLVLKFLLTVLPPAGFAAVAVVAALVYQRWSKPHAVAAVNDSDADRMMAALVEEEDQAKKREEEKRKVWALGGVCEHKSNVVRLFYFTSCCFCRADTGRGRRVRNAWHVPV